MRTQMNASISLKLNQWLEKKLEKNPFSMDMVT